MTANAELLTRLKTILADKNAKEQPAFEGVGFAIGGTLFCGVRGDQFFVLIGEERYDEILTHPLARPLEADGKPIPGWVEIIPTGIKRDVDLAGWVNNGLEYLSTLLK